MSEKKSEEVIGDLDVEKAFKLVEFYENAAGTVKGRLWTITTWILTINSALFAFAFQLYKENPKIVGFVAIELAICAVGVALCILLIVLILDHGNHLRTYFTRVNKVGAWNPKVRGLVLKADEVDEVLCPNYSARFPRFCKRLMVLAGMFAAGFVGTFFLMFFLWWLNSAAV